MWHVSAIIEQDSAVLSLRVVLFRVNQVIGLMSFTIHGLVFILRALVQLLGHQSTFLGRVVSVDIVWLHLGQVELLWTKDRSRSGDSDPSNEALSGDLEVFHGP